MATWETARPLSLVLWPPSGMLEDLDPTSKVVKISDNEADTTFEVGKKVTVTYDGGTTSPSFSFAGSVIVDGMDYPVLKFGAFLAIVGLDLSAATTKTLAQSALDASAFTECFFPETLIATPTGERKVEELISGDLVLIGDSAAISTTWLASMGKNFRKWLGFARAVPVKWIGHQTVSTRFGPAERLMPVRFAAGSLGGGQPLLPHRDLTVTADHALLVDGVLCEAGALVNGVTITRVPLSEFSDSYTVYHIETEAHEIILANGVPSETFIDNVTRRAFDNYTEFERLHGDQPEMKELPFPRASNTRHLPARIKTRLCIGAGKETSA